MTDNTFTPTDDDRKFINIARKILANEKVQQMKQYVQHGDVSTYEHCLMVCLYAYMYAKRLKLKINIEALVKGALLHDFFLYDWHKGAFTRDGLHGFSHPVTAERNARNTFSLTVKERGIIIKRYVDPLVDDGILALAEPKSKRSHTQKYFTVK